MGPSCSTRGCSHLSAHSQEEAHHAHGPPEGQGADVALHIAHGVVDGQAGHNLQVPAELSRAGLSRASGHRCGSAYHQLWHTMLSAWLGCMSVLLTCSSTPVLTCDTAWCTGTWRTGGQSRKLLDHVHL